MKLTVGGQDRAVGGDHGERVDLLHVAKIGPDIDIHPQRDVKDLIDSNFPEIVDDYLIIRKIGGE
jgi:hypothetical protein